MSLNVQLLETSFARVQPHTTEFASSFYNNLLTDYPQLRPLFANTNMEDQEKKLIMSLVLVINNVRNLAYLTTILKDLGERHVKYGTMQEHYPLVGAALLKTFESYLGSDWTPEVKQAWTDAYGAIVNVMLEGANSAEKVVKSENALDQSAKPVEIGFAPTQAPELPAVMGFAPTQANATTSSLNLKLLLIIFVVAGFLGVGLLYYHSSSKQDDSSLESCIAKTT